MSPPKDPKLAAQIVFGLVILIIALHLALPRFQQVELVLELISEVVRTLVSIVVLLLRLIRDLHQIISMTHDRFQQVVSALKLINDVVGSLVDTHMHKDLVHLDCKTTCCCCQ
ncbi:uncharacterized protein LOC115989219 [Quercus lobata]|uniref:uncharacterized protein LOC115989219 n=1 Tax=Quercus lobata TaxID=97700 RepID=UPI0012484C11|nr:uncharacterized protein LOC115989219 [Quercus lobata]